MIHIGTVPAYDALIFSRCALSETKNVITLLRAFELDVAAQAKALLSSKLGADLKDSVAAFLGTDTSDEEQSCEFRLLVSLKIRAQQEIVDEQELLIFEQAASLAATMAKLARHASEIEHAKLLSTQRQEFVAMLTHDLKNPLIGANRILDLFTGGQLGALTSTQRELLEQLISSNKESLQLITMLGDIYRYDSDPGDVHLEQSDLLSVVEFSFKAMETWSLQREIRATLTVPKSLPLMYIDRLAVQRLLDNLFGNALKFTAPKGCIDVTLTAIPGKVLIEVRDDGPGDS